MSRTLTPQGKALRDRIIVCLIEAGGQPVRTRDIERAVHRRTTDVYAHLRRLEELGVVLCHRQPELRDVCWQYIGDDLVRNRIVDLDS